MSFFGKMKTKIYRKVLLSDFVGSSETNWRFASDALRSCLDEEEMPVPSKEIAQSYVYVIATQAPRLTVGRYIEEIKQRRAPTMESPSCEKVADMVAKVLNPTLKIGYSGLGRQYPSLPNEAQHDTFLLAYMFLISVVFQ